MAVFFVCTGILGLLVVVLALNIARMRGKKRVSLGDGGDAALTAAIRAHGNLVEWAPLCLFTIYLLHGPYGSKVIAVLVALLTGGRLLHAGGMLGFIPMGRSIGASITALVLAAAAIMIALIGFGVRLR